MISGVVDSQKKELASCAPNREVVSPSRLLQDPDRSRKGPSWRERLSCFQAKPMGPDECRADARPAPLTIRMSVNLSCANLVFGSRKLCINTWIY
jgi:hypothetical protein